MLRRREEKKMKASYRVIKNWFGEYSLYFMLDYKVDTGHRGTDGTGCKNYKTEKQAEDAGKRYIRTMKGLGFEVD